jgi:Holliday junction resolvasome RuvABC ATP-dependent DNA helicase subunit
VSDEPDTIEEIYEPFLIQIDFPALPVRDPADYPALAS